MQVRCRVMAYLFNFISVVYEEQIGPSDETSQSHYPAEVFVQQERYHRHIGNFVLTDDGENAEKIWKL